MRKLFSVLSILALKWLKKEQDRKTIPSYAQVAVSNEIGEQGTGVNLSDCTEEEHVGMVIAYHIYENTWYWANLASQGQLKTYPVARVKLTYRAYKAALGMAPEHVVREHYGVIEKALRLHDERWTLDYSASTAEYGHFYIAPRGNERDMGGAEVIHHIEH